MSKKKIKIIDFIPFFGMFTALGVEMSEYGKLWFTIYHVLTMSKQIHESTMTEKNEFKSSHDLPFLSAHWNNPFNTDGWQVFKIGTCHGQWVATETTYDILSVINDEPGNGHFDDVLEWFERSCRRDKKALRILFIKEALLINQKIILLSGSGQSWIKSHGMKPETTLILKLKGNE